MASIKLRLLILVTIVSLNGCDRSDSSNDPQEIPADLVASDYMDPEDNLLWQGLIKGAITTFDSLGKVVGVDEFETTGKATLGVKQVIDGFTVRPIYAYNNKGSVTGRGPLAFLGLIDDNISVMVQGDHEIVTALPRQLKTGKEWLPVAQIPRTVESTFKILSHLPTFTNSAGKKYNDVIRTSLTYSDEISWWMRNVHGLQHECEAEVYYAKGIGPVEFVVSKFDDRIQLPEYKYHKRYVGTASRTND
jgi:hypothetical protein